MSGYVDQSTIYTAMRVILYEQNIELFFDLSYIQHSYSGGPSIAVLKWFTADVSEQLKFHSIDRCQSQGSILTRSVHLPSIAATINEG